MDPRCRIGLHDWRKRRVFGPKGIVIIKLECQRSGCHERRNVVYATKGGWNLLARIKAMHASKQQDWQTPPELFAWLQKELGFDFTLDPCTSPDNPLDTPMFFTEEIDGLKQSWKGHRVYMNPPYGDLPLWVEKAHNESQYNNTIVVGLLPVRTSPKYMRKYVWTSDAWFLDELSEYKSLDDGEIGIYFLPKRVRFIDPSTGEKTGSPYFDSMVVVWN